MFHFKKSASILLSAAMAAGSIVPAFAATPAPGEDWFTHNQIAGSKSNMDVNLLVQDEAAPVIFSAYVPAAITIAVSRDGQMITPDNLRIINGVDTLPICVKAVDAAAAPAWTLMPWDTDLKTEELTDAKKFAMTMNSQDLSKPVTGLPWEIAAGSELPLTIEAKVPNQSSAKELEKIMTVGFTMDWVGDGAAVDNKPHAKGTVMSKAKLDAVAKNLTGTLTFARTAYTGDMGAANMYDVSEAGDRSVICVVNGQDATVYGDGGVKCPNNQKDFNNGLFYKYQAKTLDVSGLDTSDVTSMAGLFRDANATSIIGLKNFDTSKVTNMYCMFYNSNVIILDLSSFNTNKLTCMRHMFYNSITTTLDLSSFDISNVSSFETYSMLCHSKAEKIYCRTEADKTKMTRSENCSVPSSAFIVGKPAA